MLAACPGSWHSRHRLLAIGSVAVAAQDRTRPSHPRACPQAAADAGHRHVLSLSKMTRSRISPLSSTLKITSAPGPPAAGTPQQLEQLLTGPLCQSFELGQARAPECQQRSQPFATRLKYSIMEKLRFAMSARSFVGGVPSSRLAILPAGYLNRRLPPAEAAQGTHHPRGVYLWDVVTLVSLAWSRRLSHRTYAYEDPHESRAVVALPAIIALMSGCKRAPRRHPGQPPRPRRLPHMQRRRAHSTGNASTGRATAPLPVRMRSDRDTHTTDRAIRSPSISRGSACAGAAADRARSTADRTQHQVRCAGLQELRHTRGVEAALPWAIALLGDDAPSGGPPQRPHARPSVGDVAADVLAHWAAAVPGCSRTLATGRPANGRIRPCWPGGIQDERIVSHCWRPAL